MLTTWPLNSLQPDDQTGSRMPTAESEALEIGALGAQGDGIAETKAGPRHVPFALPGERVQIEADGASRLVSAPSADRVTAPCRHFGVCGGCAAQHMSGR